MRVQDRERIGMAILMLAGLALTALATVIATGWQGLGAVS